MGALIAIGICCSIPVLGFMWVALSGGFGPNRGKAEGAKRSGVGKARSR